MFVDEHRKRFGVELICRVLEVSASAYYQRAMGERSARDISDERLLAEIKRVHGGNYEAYGSRRVWKELCRQGIECARCTVERLMAKNGIQGAKRRGRPWRTTTPDPEGQRKPDLVDRDFSAEAPNRLWVADFTHLRTWQGVVFFSFVIDVFSRKIVGWQLATNMRTDLVLDALRMALGLRSPGADVALVHHSDRGSQYTSAEFTQELDDNDVLGSLGSTGDAYDCPRGELRRLLQDRADRRPHLALGRAGRTGDRRVGELVQPRPPALFDRRHPASRVRAELLGASGRRAAAQLLSPFGLAPPGGGRAPQTSTE
jgi:putative transposase